MKKRLFLFAVILFVVSTAIIYYTGREKTKADPIMIANSTVSVISDGEPILIDTRDKPVLFFSPI